MYLHRYVEQQVFDLRPVHDFLRRCGDLAFKKPKDRLLSAEMLLSSLSCAEWRAVERRLRLSWVSLASSK
jgi:hypothetical protein